MAEIIEKTSTDAWKQAISMIIEKGEDFSDNEGRKFRQLLNVSLTITEPSLDIKNPINILSQSDKWLYPSIDEIRGIFLRRKTMHPYEYTYGQRIFNYGNALNQIDSYVIPYLKDKINKNTRRLYVSLWNPLKDANFESRVENPGLVGIWLKMVDNKLTATAVIRNNDCFIGFPANLYQVHTLQEYIAEKTGIEPGRIVFYSLSMHIYIDHLDEIKSLLDI